MTDRNSPKVETCEPNVIVRYGCKYDEGGNFQPSVIRHMLEGEYTGEVQCGKRKCFKVTIYMWKCFMKTNNST